MKRFATLCVVVVWSASIAAENVKPLVESNDQRLEFSNTMQEANSPGYVHNTGNWSGMPTFGSQKSSLPRLGLYSYIVPRPYEDARFHADSQVFDRALTPGLSVNLFKSSVILYRHGLRYEADNAPWFINVNYRNANRGSKLMIQEQPDATKAKALLLEVGVNF